MAQTVMTRVECATAIELDIAPSDPMLRGETGKGGIASYRNGNAVRSIDWRLLLVLAFLSLRLLAQPPPEIQADLHTLRAQSAMEDQDYAGARVELEKLLELQAQHDLPVPVEFYFRYATVLQRQGALEDAFNNVLRYVGQAGHEGGSYTEALKLMDRLEHEFAEEDRAGRERVARAEREAAEARVAATRERAAKELPSEISAMEFVPIPAGRFRMGSGLVPDGAPLHQVWISQDFELGKYEVTQSEWTAVMGQNPSSDPCQRCPVTNVSWNDVQEFIGILNQAAGQASPYRLPTEAEWEYAARAGTTGERYASDLDAIAWHGGNSDRRSHPVGEKTPNTFGLHDTLGNVWEWVQDWYGGYSVRGVTDPVGPSEGSYRVIRGGSWRLGGSDCRAAYRLPSSPGHRFSRLGFRLARTVQ